MKTAVVFARDPQDRLDHKSFASTRIMMMEGAAGLRLAEIPRMSPPVMRTRTRPWGLGMADRFGGHIVTGEVTTDIDLPCYNMLGADDMLYRPSIIHMPTWAPLRRTRGCAISIWSMLACINMVRSIP